MADRAGSRVATILDGRLNSVSPSSIGTWEHCELKFVLEKRFKWAKKPPGKGAKLGSECHSRLEHYLLRGEDVRGTYERAGADMLEPYLWAAPFNKGPGLVEPSFEFQTAGGVRVGGFIDFYVPGSGDAVPVIIDHKFKADVRLEPEGYATPPEALRKDPQALIYGMYALRTEPGAFGVEFRHHNHQTKGPRIANPVGVTFTRAELFERFGVLEKTIDESMSRAASTPCETEEEAARIFSFADTGRGGCMKFGGCDFIDRCPKSPLRRYRDGLQSGTTVVTSLMSPAAKEKNSMGLLKAPEVAAPTPAISAHMVVRADGAKSLLTEVKDCVAGQLYTLPAGGIGKFFGAVGGLFVFRGPENALVTLEPSAIVVSVNSDPVSNAVFEKAAKPASETPVAVVMVTPPDMPPEPKPSPEAAKIEVQATELAAKAVEATPVVATPVAAVEVTAAEVDAKPKRAKKATPALVAAPTAADVPAGPSDFVLLVNTSVTVLKPGSTCHDLNVWVSELAAALAKAHGAPDIRLGNKNSDLGFGGWKAMLAIEALKNPPLGLCAIQSGELTDPVIEALAPKAALVVRGGVR